MEKYYICVEGQQGGRGRQVSWESRGRKFILLVSWTDWMMMTTTATTIGERPRQRDVDAGGRGKKKERAEMDPPKDGRTNKRKRGGEGGVGRREGGRADRSTARLRGPPDGKLSGGMADPLDDGMDGHSSANVNEAIDRTGLQRFAPLPYYILLLPHQR